MNSSSHFLSVLTTNPKSTIAKLFIPFPLSLLHYKTGLDYLLYQWIKSLTWKCLTSIKQKTWYACESRSSLPKWTQLLILLALLSNVPFLIQRFFFPILTFHSFLDCIFWQWTPNPPQLRNNYCKCKQTRIVQAHLPTLSKSVRMRNRESKLVIQSQSHFCFFL